jgi:Bacterial aa3 type cytochrome c oxidase subunit IV
MAKDLPHSHGSMDIREHKKTYEAFWSVSVYTTIGVVLLMVFLAWMFT